MAYFLATAAAARSNAYRSHVSALCLTFYGSVLVMAALLATPGGAARLATFYGHQVQDSVDGQPSVGQPRGQRSSGNRHDQHSPAHHPSSPHSSTSSALTTLALERYVDERIEKLEARFNQRIDDQSRKLNQTIAIQYIERVSD